MKIQHTLDTIERELRKMRKTQDKMKEGLINKGILPEEAVGVPE